MQNLLPLLLLAGSSSALYIQESTEVEESARTESLLYPLILNPWQISHWNCFGTTLYENTDISNDYTYTVDVCFTAVIAAKLLFPWFYQAHTGNSLLSALGIDLGAKEAAEDGYGAPAEAYAAPATDEYGAPAYQAPEEGYGAPETSYGAPEATYGAPEPSYGAPQPSYESPPAYEQRRNGKTPSFQERLSSAFKDLSKAIKKNNPLKNSQ